MSFRFKNVLVMATVAAMVLWSGCAMNQERSETAGSGVQQAERQPQSDPAHVLAKLQSANEQEIQAGKLAQSKGTTREVRNFGQTLVQDHQKAQQMIQDYAKQNNIEVGSYSPATSEEREQQQEDQQAMSQLRNLTGQQFDEKFLQSMEEGHANALETVTEARDQIEDESFKTLMTQLEPVLSRHYARAESLSETL